VRGLDLASVKTRHRDRSGAMTENEGFSVVDRSNHGSRLDVRKKRVLLDAVETVDFIK